MGSNRHIRLGILCDVIMNKNTGKLIVALAAIGMLTSLAGATNTAPQAQLEISPNPALTGDRLKFDATGSSGNIERYLFDFDGDGTYDKVDYDGIAYRTVDHEFSGRAKVKVRAENGLTDTDTEFYEVEPYPGECNLQAGFIRLDTTRIQKGDSTTARVNVYNNGDTQNVQATFKVDGVVVSESEKVVEDYHTFTASVSPDEDARVSVVLDTEGPPCGSREIGSSYTRLAVYDTVEQGRVDVIVEDRDGNRIENARVTFGNSEGTQVETTGSRGRVTFTGDPGNYEVRASKSRYFADSKRITLEEGGRKTVRLELRERQKPSTLTVVTEDSDGDPIRNMEVNVRNGEDLTRLTDFAGEAVFEVEEGEYAITAGGDDHQIEERTVSLDSGEERTVVIEMERLDPPEEREARLDVKVRDRSGDELEGAKVRVANGDVDTDLTDSRGRSSFSLELDRYTVRVSKFGYETESRTVNLGEGDFRTLSFELSRSDTDQDSRLDVVVEDLDGDPIRNADVRVRNGETRRGETGSSGRTSFILGPDTYDVTVSKSGYLTEDREVELRRGDSKTLRFTPRRTDGSGRDAHLDVTVRDEHGDRLDGVRVEARNGDNKVRFTGSRGTATFSLEPDSYRVEVSRSGYGTESRSVRLSEGESDSISFQLERRDGARGLSIKGIGFSNVACRGDDYTVTVNAENTGSRELVELRVSGFGDTDSSSFSLGKNQVVTRELVLEDVQGSGNEQFTVTLENSEVRTATRTVTVESCDGGNGDNGDSGDTVDASSVSARVNPQKITIGESTRVSGYVDGVRGRADVDIFLDGRKVADIQTQPDGFYQTFVQPQNTGRLEVRVESGDEEAVNEVNVLPSVEVTSMSAPEKVFENQEFQVCSNVESQVDARVVLLEDGQPLQTRYSEGEVCFQTESSRGEKEFAVSAYAGGNQDSKSRNVEVLELGNEVENFPDQMAMVRTGDGITRVTLYNTGEEERRYDLEMGGIPEDWFSQTSKSVVLTPGERRHVYFYVTPEAEGDFSADISVSRDGNRIYQQQIRISSGGTTKSGESFLDSLVALFRL